MHETRAGERKLSWAEAELGGTDLGDARRTRRLVKVVEDLSERPESSIPQACGLWKDTKAAYRFLDNDHVEPEAILGAHRDRTLERMRGHAVVLALQDTTAFTIDGEVQGVGLIGGMGSTGFLTHSCLAVSAQGGVPLGLLGQYTWAREMTPQGNWRKRNLSVEDKESVRWQRMLVESTRDAPTGTRVVTVADREADIYDFFATASEARKSFLIRIAHGRRRVHGEAKHLRETLAQAPVYGVMDVTVPRSRTRGSRIARLEVQFTSVTLAPTRRADSSHPKPLPLTGILVREKAVPGGREAPIEWCLLTNDDIQNVSEAIERVTWYSYRWRIERFHYVLKSGCRVEELQLQEFSRLERAVAVYSIIAWFLAHLTYEARVNPHASAGLFLDHAEWRVLYRVVTRKVPPPTPPTIRECVRLLAQLGGFLARRSDGEPGVAVIWRGYRRLQDAMIGYEAALDVGVCRSSSDGAPSG